MIYAARSSKLTALFNVMLSEMGDPLKNEQGGDTNVLEQSFPQRRPDSKDPGCYNVLILCSGNSARSIMVEAILNREGASRFRAFSAGNRPQEKPNPMAISLLNTLGYDTSGLRSKSWDVFAGPDALTMDFIITVCDGSRGSLSLLARTSAPGPLGPSRSRNRAGNKG